MVCLEAELDPDDPTKVSEGWITTFSDPDGNYFQLMSPMEALTESEKSLTDAGARS